MKTNSLLLQNLESFWTREGFEPSTYRLDVPVLSWQLSSPVLDVTQQLTAVKPRIKTSYKVQPGMVNDENNSKFDVDVLETKHSEFSTKFSENFVLDDLQAMSH